MTRMLARLLIAIITLFSTATIFAETKAEYFPPPAGTMTAGIAGKRTGDIIAVQTDDGVAAYCDFDKQIVTTRTSILCKYNGKQPPS